MPSAGIVGLPNVGKSTLFNAVTRTRKAESANYPFCTIEPNTGVVTVPDHRLAVLADISKTQKIIPATIELVDIAGLVAGASKGEGLGNQFLAAIREVDAILQVVRCFENGDIHHVAGTVDPVRDIEIIMTELGLADIASLEKRLDRLRKGARSGDKAAKAELDLSEKLIPHLNDGKPALTFPMSDEERRVLRTLFLLTAKPVLFACNVSESDLASLGSGEANFAETPAGRHVAAVRAYAREQMGAGVVVISAQIESELTDLSPEDAKEYLEGIGVAESGVGELIRAVYRLLGLQTYLTTGEKETRAWTIPVGAKAPQAAGVIHSDFERGFIAAEIVAYDLLAETRSFAKAKEMGKLRIEGKEYVMQDGDVVEFRFNV